MRRVLTRMLEERFFFSFLSKVNNRAVSLFMAAWADYKTDGYVGRALFLCFC